MHWPGWRKQPSAWGEEMHLNGFAGESSDAEGYRLMEIARKAGHPEADFWLQGPELKQAKAGKNARIG